MLALFTWVRVMAPVPGHVSWRRPVESFQKSLKELGVSFEAEGDVTRIHVDGVVIEVSWDSGIGVIQATLPLPCDGGDADYYVRAFKAFAFILASLNGVSFEYDLDLSIPGYPMLRARSSFSSFEVLASFLVKVLGSYLMLSG